MSIRSLVFASALIAAPAGAASYGYYMEAGPLTRVQEGYDPCGGPKWISHHFDLNEDLVPGGTLINAHLSFEGWAPHEVYEDIVFAPDWSSDLLRADEGIFYIEFDMTRADEGDRLSLYVVDRAGRVRLLLLPERTRHLRHHHLGM